METIKVEVYKYFADFVYEKTGIFYSEKDYYRLDKRITDMVAQFDVATSDDLLKKFQLNRNADMEKFLIDICTNNETYFFRDQKPFDALTKEIYPKWKDSLAGAPLKIWSCASSTGQEPISIIMSLMNTFGTNSKFTIDATDISTQALDKAKSGIYSGLDVQRGLPIQSLMKYFEALKDNSWKLKDEYLKLISYSIFNLFTGNFVPNKYHVIYCRNVLIYQNKENKKKILESLTKSLMPGGYLLLGAGESLIGMDINLKQESLADCMVFTKEK